jgi:hypothetical protein
MDAKSQLCAARHGRRHQHNEYDRLVVQLERFIRDL